MFLIAWFLVITWAQTLKSHFQDSNKKNKRTTASATFVKLVNRAYANESLPEVHREEIIWMEDLEQTLHVNRMSEIIKWFGNMIENNFEIFFGKYFDIFSGN